MSIHAGRSKLGEAVKKLRERWDRTEQDWRDVRSGEFEQQYVEPMISEARQAVEAMAVMGELLDRAKRDCREEE